VNVFLPKVHSARGHAPVWRQGRNGSGGSIGSICNRTTRNCVFSLDTTRAEAQNSRNFSDCSTVRGRHGGPDRKEIARRFNGLDLLVLTKESPPEYGCRLYLETAGIEGEKACSTCLVGLCNASIRNVRREATGCAQACPEENFAAIVVRRCTTYRRRWLHACGCGLARWAATGHRGVPQDVRGSRQSRALGPARPDTIGASRPRRFPSSSI